MKYLTYAIDRLLILLIAVLGALTICALPFVPKVFLPAGDAIILFEYSRNLAHTGVISFITSGPHAEGATDFAWMVIIALGMKLGIEPHLLVEILSSIALIGLAVLLIKIAGKQPKLLPILFIAGAFALLPQVFSAALGFSTIPFAFLLALLAYCFLQQNDVALPLVALLLCLFRPDGIVFALPVMLAALIQYPNKARRLLLAGLLFVLPGLIYFVWRWHYFGQMLPLPFLVKANTPRLWHVIVESSLYGGLNLCWLSAIVLFFALFGHMRIASNRALLLCFVVLPNFFYFAMRLDQNIALRFFIYLPVGTAILLAMNWDALRPRRSFLFILTLVAGFILLAKLWKTSEQTLVANRPEQAKAIGDDLAKLPTGTLIATEAGELPFYSRWVSYDAWGLNTPAFATRLFQPSDVAAIRPDLILVFTFPRTADCAPKSDWHPPYSQRTWQNLTRNIVSGADNSKYELWLVPVGSARFRAENHIDSWKDEQFCFFVRRDGPQRSNIDAILMRHNGISMAQYRSLQLASEASEVPPSSVAPDSGNQPPLRFISRAHNVFRRLCDWIWMELPD